VGAFQVVPLGFSRPDRSRFLRAGMGNYDGDRNFVPQLRSDLLRRTDPARNPFFRHADVDHLVLVRDGRDLGRVAAIRNRRAEEFRGDRTGYFGWFECIEDPAAARLLLDGARERLAARGCDRMLGPVSYSTNDGCGLLVEGFDGPPALLMPYNPPWYEGLLAGAGLAPAEDLLAWDLPYAGANRDRMKRIAERAQSRYGWSLRSFRMDRFDEEIASILAVYNRAWEANWGFVPMTGEEFRFAAADLRGILKPEMVLVAEREGRVVGFFLALPDMNQVLRHLGGSLFPFGWWKALRLSPKVDYLRVLALGVLPEERHHGLDAGLYLEAMDRCHRLGYRGAECSWVLARNREMNAGLEALGGRAYRRYRLFEGPVPA